MRPPLQRLGRLCHPVARAWTGLRGPAGLTVLCWHRIDDAPGPLSCTPAELSAAFDALEAWGAVVLPLAEAWERVRTGTLPARSVALTFDDGYASTLTAAWPLLQARGWPATSFVVPGYLTGDRAFPWDSAAGHPARLMTAEQVQALARDGMDVGSHTMTHRWLPRLDDDALHEELVGSRRLLEELLDRPVPSLAYPAGHHDPRVRRAVRQAGYAVAYSTARGRSSARTGALEVRRTVVPREPEDLLRVLDGAYALLRPVDAVRERRLLRDPVAHPDPSAGVPAQPDLPPHEPPARP
ncbi:MAG: putative xylanase/chitin deacetylase [Frankiales bacterium]|nr:putative xylanase/chitin deacetylase [Frankiales bacterium]